MIGEKRKILGKDGKRHAVAYARVWEDDLEKDPEAQFKLIREWASKNDIVIDKEFSDRSDGRNKDVKGLTQMFGYLIENEDANIIAVVEPGRFCRDFNNLSDYKTPFDRLGMNFFMLTHKNIDPKNALSNLLFQSEIHYAELRYLFYVEYGVKPILGEISFKDYLNTVNEYYEGREITWAKKN